VTGLRVAAVGDLHCGRTSQGDLRAVFEAAGAESDVVLLCGDLTDYGLPEEARILAKELAGTVKVPVLAVLGNHDHESGFAEEVVRILTDAGVKVMEGDGVEVAGVGFAGIKGFCGGFGQRTLEPWGEPIIKQFVREAMEEALKLETALAKLRTRQKVAVLHYAPIAATVVGEPTEIYPFLGSSRLEEPLNRYGVAAVFHGHAHRGSLEGRLTAGAPVYNVAMPLLKRTFPDRPPVRFVEIEPPSDPERERRSGMPTRRAEDRTP
jgi:Icc-related predicted phosphoesterase